MLSRISRGALLACAVAVSLSAQQAPSADAQGLLRLRYATFDPQQSAPQVPTSLRAPAGCGLHIVQFRGTPTQAGRDVVAAAGGRVVSYLPDDAYVVRIGRESARRLAADALVRWVGVPRNCTMCRPQPAGARSEVGTCGADCCGSKVA